MKIKRNDNVMILAGKDKGKTGVIERVYPDTAKLVVKGIALAKSMLSHQGKIHKAVLLILI
jgi:large subunit ribosomal protein L24